MRVQAMVSWMVMVFAVMIVCGIGVSQAATILWYRFETNNGSAVTDGQVITRLDDSSGNGYHGTGPVNSPTYSDDRFANLWDGGTPVTNNAAGNFVAASSQNVSAGNVNPVGSSSFTVEALVRKAVASQTLMGIIKNDDVNSQGWALWLDNSQGTGTLSLGLNDDAAGNYDLRSNNPLGRINDTAWHHVAATIDRENNVAKLYLDHIEVGSWNVPLLTGSLESIGAGDLRVGVHRTNSRYWNGALDEIRISSGVLPVSQFLLIPEPGTALLFGLPLAGLLLRRRSRK